MIKTFRLAGYELRRFKGPLPILGLLFLLLIPTLVGALYLWSNWDPYGKTDQVPVAVVNEDVSVEVTDGHLALSGHRKEEAEEKRGNYYRTEREYGSFYRAVPLPDGIKADDVKATFANGVLDVSVPLPPQTESSARKIAVEAPTAAQ